MAETTLDVLLVRIDADMAGLKTELAKAGLATDAAGRKMQTAMKSAGDGFEKLASTARRAFGSLGVQLGVAALAAFGVSAVRGAAHIANLADAVGLSAQRFQEYQFAAATASVSTEELGQALSFFARRVGDARNGSNEAIDAFRALGVGTQELNGAARSQEAILRDVADAIRAMEDPAKRMAATNALMGRGSRDLVNWLARGATGFDEASAAIARYNVVLGPEAIGAARQFDDAIAISILAAKSWAAQSPDLAARAFKPWWDAYQQYLVEPFRALGRLLQEKGPSLTPGGTPGAPQVPMSGEPLKIDIAKSPAILPESKEQIAAREKINDLIASLEMERTALSMTSREQAIYAATAKLGAEATEEQRGAIELLTGQIFDAKESADLLTKGTEGWIAAAQASVEASDAEAASIAKLESARADLLIAIEKEIGDNERLIAALRLGEKEYEITVAHIELMNRARAAGAQLGPEEIENLRRQAELIGEQRHEMDRLKESIDANKAASRDFAHAIGTAFEDAIISGQGLRGVLKGLADDLQRIALRTTVTKPLENMLMSALSGGIGGLFGGSGNAFQLPGGGLSSFGGPRAHGGPVDRRVPYLIGEHGPEIFTPDVPGIIIPNNRVREFYEGGGQTPGTGPSLGGHYGKGFPDFASYADALARDETGIGRVFTGLAGMMPGIGGLAFGALNAAASAYGATPGIQGAPGEGGFSVDQSAYSGEGFAGSPELGGRSDPSQGGGGGPSDGPGTGGPGDSSPGYASGGVPPIGRPALVGERGPEIFMPSYRGNSGRGGGSSMVNVTIAIDARGAEPGAELRIRAAADQIKLETLAAVRSLSNRGGGFARDVGRR